jgi:hypothetical protein
MAVRMLAATIVMLGWSVMSAWGQDRGHGDADMAPPAAGRTPKGAGAYFHHPICDICIRQRITVPIGQRGLALRRLGLWKSKSGAHAQTRDACPSTAHRRPGAHAEWVPVMSKKIMIHVR